MDEKLKKFIDERIDYIKSQARENSHLKSSEDYQRRADLLEDLRDALFGW